MNAVLAAMGVAAVIAGGVYAWNHHRFGLWWSAFWAVICALASALDAARNWGLAALMAAATVILVLAWWYHWRKRHPVTP